MDEMPAGRQPVETHVLSPIERERAYQLIRSQVSQGLQAFIVYPLIENSNESEVKAAVNEHDQLQTDIFPEFKLGLLHGRMKPDEKDRVMLRFREKEFQILVSTTVIEVGVDVPMPRSCLSKAPRDSASRNYISFAAGSDGEAKSLTAFSSPALMMQLKMKGLR